MSSCSRHSVLSMDTAAVREECNGFLRLNMILQNFYQVATLARSMLRVGGGASNCQSVHFRHTGWWLDRSTVVDTTRIHFRQSAVQQRAVSCIAAAVKTGPPDLELRGIASFATPSPSPSPSSPVQPRHPGRPRSASHGRAQDPAEGRRRGRGRPGGRRRNLGAESEEAAGRRQRRRRVVGGFLLRLQLVVLDRCDRGGQLLLLHLPEIHDLSSKTAVVPPQGYLYFDLMVSKNRKWSGRLGLVAHQFQRLAAEAARRSAKVTTKLHFRLSRFSLPFVLVLKTLAY